jgi:hypothetical protein
VPIGTAQGDELLSGRDALERGLRPVAEALARRSLSPQRT